MEGAQEAAIGRDVVGHVLAGSITSRLPRVAGHEAHLFHLRRPLCVVSTGYGVGGVTPAGLGQCASLQQGQGQQCRAGPPRATRRVTRKNQ